MDARTLAAERGLVPRAVAALTSRALGALAFEALGPTKGLLKRFFSAQPWDERDDAALADAVGPGEGWWDEPLDDDLVLSFGWVEGRFRLRVEGGGDAREDASPLTDALAATFDGDVVPEATPNPRTLAFRTGAVSAGESREYRSRSQADDPRVARLFETSDDVAGVLVARDFVAVTVRRPDRWPELLAPVLAVVSEEFAGGDRAAAAPGRPGMAALHREAAARAGRTSRVPSRLDRAWADLAGVRADDAGGVERLLAAAASPEAALRQVAASRLGEVAADVSAGAWARLARDPSRTVRRAAVDAVVDAGRQDLRPLLEHALGDADAWVRWKALRGLAELGTAPSRPAVEPLLEDPDFRVRLEARSALRR
ncbi:MAG TPA: HEAT repeat domain-containing protein [Acidimicrobiales bacterium]|nr:HEAT repeat domain-containing protein [Acidimicrobiales bacterium]